MINLDTEAQIAVFESDPVTGEYYSILNESTRLALYVERQGYLFESYFFEISKEEKNSISKDIYLKPIKKGNSVRLNNIFFEFNSATLTDDSKTELNKVLKFLNNNPNVKILIAGHTDDQGADGYNLVLSEKRARAVYDFLIIHGINQDELTYVGYGESKPLVDNQSEENRQINRRIEFLVNE